MEESLVAGADAAAKVEGSGSAGHTATPESPRRRDFSGQSQAGYHLAVALLFVEPVQPPGFERIRDKSDLRYRELSADPAEAAGARPRCAYQPLEEAILGDVGGQQNRAVAT
jgi:hypothetical protein